MKRASLFFKVEVEHDSTEQPEKIGAQIVRQLEKMYGVRIAELTHVTANEP